MFVVGLLSVSLLVVQAVIDRRVCVGFGGHLRIESGQNYASGVGVTPSVGVFVVIGVGIVVWVIVVVALSLGVIMVGSVGVVV